MFQVFRKCITYLYVQYFTICLAELKDYQHKVFGNVFWSPEQETEIMNIVLENNVITLRQIQRKIIENNDMFQKY